MAWTVSLLRLVHAFQDAAGQRLAELGAVAVQRVGLGAQTPGQHIGVLALSRTVASFGMLMVLEMAPEMKG